MYIHLYLPNRQHSKVAVPSTIRNPILNLLHEAQYKPTLATHMNAQIGQMFSDGIKSFCQRHAIEMSSIDLVGTHTPSLARIYHRSTAGADNHQLGWNAIIQANTGLTTVFDFMIIERAVARPHISPVAFVDRLFLRHSGKVRACLSIDELTNITFVPVYNPNSTRGTMSHACGPGSLFIDYAMRYCTSNAHDDDNDGKFAAEGNVNQVVIDRFLNAHDYLRSAPPLNIAREMFGDHEAQRLIDECLFSNMCDVDTVATITRVTAQNILKQYRRLLDLYFPQGMDIDELFICGPSASNTNIIDYLEAELPESVITRPLDDVGIPGNANEAVCYAHLALEAVLGQTTQVMGGDALAAREPPEEAVRARIVCGENWEELLGRIRRFSGGKPLSVSKDVKVAGNIAAAVRGLDLQ